MIVRYGDQEVSCVVRQTAAVMGRIRIHVSCASCFTILRRLVKNLRSRLYSAICRSVIDVRSEEHTSELQSLMRISYAVFCLKKKKYTKQRHHTTLQTSIHQHTKQQIEITTLNITQ